MCSHTSGLIHPCVCLIHGWKSPIFIQDLHSAWQADNSCMVLLQDKHQFNKTRTFHGSCRLGKSHPLTKFSILNGLCNLMACLNSSKSQPAPDRARTEQPAWAVGMHRGEQRQQAGAAFPRMPCGGQEPFRMGHTYSTASVLWPGLHASCCLC